VVSTPNRNDAFQRKSVIAWGVLLALLVIAPFIGIYPVFMMKALCFAIFACAFNLLLGFTGLLSFGHAAFMGSAAYITGWLVRSAGWTPELGIVAGTLVAAALGLVVGLIPMANDLAMYFFVLAVFVAVFVLILRIVHSPYGQVLKAIRENEPRAISLGYDVDRYKLLAFVLSTGIAGLAGAMKTFVLGFATLSDVHWSLSGEVILMTLLGGMGTFAGPVLGAFTIIGLQDYLADTAGSWVTVIIGVIFVVCVIAFRRGFVGELIAWQKRK